MTQNNTADSNKTDSVDCLIVGAGIAGLSLALKLAKNGLRSRVLAKGSLVESNTWYAQGGIASVLDPLDSLDNHIRDTLTAGDGLCRVDVVNDVISRGPGLIEELIAIGAKFDQDPTGLHLTKEGGHSHRRVIHSKDITGQEVARALIRQAEKSPHISIVENQVVIDLVTTDKVAPMFSGNRCLGAYVMDRKTGSISTMLARFTVLCTGGHGKLYLYTSNPDSATGDGVAIAWRAGCKVANLEMMQFHPTCLYHPSAKNFLISEAVRGEGGILRDSSGRSFMEEYHPLGSLAPRDIVARAIDTEIKKTGSTHVYLDVTHLGEEKIKRYFPNIFQACISFGIDISKQQIPVVPAAHYSCGGVVVNEFGQTTVGHLFAIGEVACTGLHGANRLASNSLLEALVYADKSSQALFKLSQEPIPQTPHVETWRNGVQPPDDEPVVIHHAWDEIRRLMWNYVGIVRSERRLKRALDRLEVIRQEIDEYWWQYRPSPQVLEVRNLATVAWLTVRCAMARKESRGIHFMLDYPAKLTTAKDIILQS